MFHSTKNVSSVDAKAQIMNLTVNIKNETLKIYELFQTQETIGYGYITVPTAMEDAMVLDAIRYKDAKDVYFKHIRSWFDVEFAWYDKESKQVMVWGEYNKVNTSIIELKELLEYTLKEDLKRMVSEDLENERKVKQQARLRRMEERDNEREYDAFKHT